MDTAQQEASATAGDMPGNDWRQRARLPLPILGPVLVAAAAVYFYMTAGRFQSTDEAYVMAARVAISANVAGRVSERRLQEAELGYVRALAQRYQDAVELLLAIGPGA